MEGDTSGRFVQARQEDQVVSRYKGQKTGGLLTYLAYHLRQMHSREVLIVIFWLESVPQSGKASLSTALSSLRHQLEPPGIPSGFAPAPRFPAGPGREIRCL